jgi:hypothetical protein
MSKRQNNCLLRTDGEQIYYICSGSRKNNGCYFHDNTKTFGCHCAKSQYLIEADEMHCTSNRAIKHLKDSFFTSYVTRFTPITIQEGD